ncbi:Cytochrome P450 2J2 [Hypsibius exemplaris]|uniref:Cytochrome P450 2J2 n=1 Tax=Hypsibius exemplaris TaxID=2072580 RepID=A0A1W0WA05_HYPEX|nr:Cytochrome P450 2J2 [Hypsibius exemplaris]
MLEYILQWHVLLSGVLVSLTVAWFVFGSKRSNTLPPGPPPQPIIGNLGRLRGKQGKQRYRTLAKMVDEYGKDGVATIYLGSRPVVFVTNFEALKTIAHSDEMSGRPTSIRDELFHRQGLIFTDGEAWKEQRRFALTTLREFGMGKTWLQDLIIEEAQELIEDFKSYRGTPVDPNHHLLPSVCNIICAISYGQRFSHKDANFSRLTRLVGENVTLTATNLLVEYFPFLRKIPFSKYRARYLAWMANVGAMSAFFDTLVEQHQQSLHDGEPRDYLHAFMLEAEKQKDNAESTFNSHQLMVSVINLFGAGTETTATTLAWAIVYLLNNPVVYDKVQTEIDGVLGDGQYPTMDMKDRLPYTQATLFEIQRLSNLVPIIGRRAMDDVTLNGFKIPAGTDIFPMLTAVHEDARYFPDPLAFKPDRFLDEDGNLRSKVDGFIPFAIGKRFCLGESLAKMELYLFFVSLVKHFRFRVPPGASINIDDSVMGLLHAPKPYNVIFEAR